MSRFPLALTALFVAPALGANALSAQCGWDEKAFLTPSSGYGTIPQYFGRAISLDQDLAAIGAPGLEGAPGSMLVFEDVGGSWVETQIISPAAPQAADDFGRAVSAAGETILVGAPGTDLGDGAAFVFERVAGQWIETRLTPQFALPAEADFGRAVALVGNVALVGAPGQNVVHVFENVGGTWSPSTTLVPTTPQGTDDSESSSGEKGFGAVLAFDGMTALVADTNDQSVQVFTTNGSLWTPTQLLVQDILLDGDFGEALALDGTRALIGAPDDLGQGSAHMYDLIGGIWTETATLPPPAVSWLDEFGASVGISGNTAIVGAPAEEEGLGLAHVYQYTVSGWTRVDSLSPPLLDAQDQEGQFAAYVGVYGTTIMTSIGLDETPFFGSAQTPYAGAVDVWQPATTGCASVYGVPNQVSVGAGGTQKIYVDAGPDEGGLLYLVLGSMSGTAPGVAYGGFQIPLNQDVYLDYTLTHVGSAPLTSGFGTLSPTGIALASFWLPPASNPLLAGLQVNHAFVVIDTTVGAVVTSVSNATPVSLIP